MADETQVASDKELNFRKLEESFRTKQAEQQRAFDEEKAARQRVERELEEIKSRLNQSNDDDDDDPYIDQKKLSKTLQRFGQETNAQTKNEIQRAVNEALHNERKSNWLRNHPDFAEVLNKYSEALAERDPELAETILEMPQGFERQKLVYKNIKAMGIDKPAAPTPTIQDKVDQNRRSPFYQPSGVGASPYSMAGDFSESGQKASYAKMQELKSKLRI